MKELKREGKLIASVPRGIDPRAPGSNYLPFDEKIGKAKDFPDTKKGRDKMFDKLKDIRVKYNPAGKGYGLGDI
jgi:hypothetical protein